MKQHHPILRKQTGGTFLGLILGLIIGLGIAVAVALMITKSPIPFVNKVARQERPELSPDQAADPNKPLYGNRDTTAADKSADQSAPPAKPATDVKKPDAVTPPPAPASADAGKDKASAKDAGTASSNSAADDKWIYFLQTGAFREQADAESARAKLALLGFEAKVSDRPSDTGSLYRVRIGPITQVETVNRMRTKLSDNGIDAAVVRVPK